MDYFSYALMYFATATARATTLLRGGAALFILMYFTTPIHAAGGDCMCKYSAFKSHVFQFCTVKRGHVLKNWVEGLSDEAYYPRGHSGKKCLLFRHFWSYLRKRAIFALFGIL